MSTHISEERPVVVHAFATGRALLDRTHGEMGRMRERAASLWERGPSAVADDRALRLRFHLTDLVRDLADLPEGGATTALVGAECLRLAVESFCAVKQLWRPGLRDLPGVVERCDPEIGRLVRECAVAGFSRSTSRQLGIRVLADLGGPLETYDTRPA